MVQSQRWKTNQSIQQALDLGYDVEIDVWLIDGNFSLGRRRATISSSRNFLMKKGLWCHAKNIDLLYLYES